MATSYLKKLYDWLKFNFWDIFLVAILLGVSIFVSYRNYTSGTFLTGWDNLHPEFNFPLNIHRSFSAAWQEYQGLGLLGGMAHAADLPRQVTLWILSIFVSVDLLRYFWTFLMFAIGPIGVYFFIKSFTSRISGFAAATFYLFNLGTVQTFFTPFETFVAFFGFFPWLLYFATDYLKNGGKKKLFTYTLISAVATGAFYVQTMFVVYLIFVSVFILESVVTLKKNGLFRSIKLFLVTFFINSFWLLPVLYFVITSGATPSNSHINSIATPETHYMNEARGNFVDIATLKGYWLDYYEWIDSKYDYLYKDWISYGEKPYVKDVSLVLFYISILGIVASMFKKGNPHKFSLPVLFFISYLFLAGSNPPFGEFYKFISDKIPFFAEIFRNSFTKWSIPMIFLCSVGIGLIVNSIGNLARGKVKLLLVAITSILVTSASIYTVFPVFQGNLVSKIVKVNIPQDYFEVFKFFNSQDKTKRIATFPLTDFWGWHFNSWGHTGSGFLWYGIAQPILDRNFDVWSPYNENFYDEVSYSVNYGSISDLENILEKYQVSYILFDESIFEPGSPDSPLNIQKQKSFLESSNVIHKTKSFGKITIYEVDFNDKKLFISAPKSLFTGSSFQKISGTPEITELFSPEQGYSEAKNCDLKGKGSVVKERTSQGNRYVAHDGGISCDYFYYPGLDYSKAHLMRIKGKNLTGRSLKIYLYNVGGKRVDVQELFPKGTFDEYFEILPTGEGTGQGYTLNVETRSFGKVESENIIESIEFYPADFKDAEKQLAPGELKVIEVKKYGTWGYKVDIEGGGILQLAQSFEDGWIAFQIKGSKIQTLKHIKLNNWANGWEVPEDSTSRIYVLFWPQLLEWGGMILGVLSLSVLIFRKRLSNIDLSSKAE